MLLESSGATEIFAGGTVPQMILTSDLTEDETQKDSSLIPYNCV